MLKLSSFQNICFEGDKMTSSDLTMDKNLYIGLYKDGDNSNRNVKQNIVHPNLYFAKNSITVSKCWYQVSKKIFVCHFIE